MLSVAFPPKEYNFNVNLEKQKENHGENDHLGPHLKSKLDSEINDVLSSIRQLLIKYQMYNRAKESQAVSGGLQQFIINKLKRKGEHERSLTQRLKALYLKDDSVYFHAVASTGEEKALFDCLPVDIRLHIFSYLDARSLCQACRVSHSWNQLLWDDMLWRQRLTVDKLVWPQVSHLTNPHIYTEAASDLSYKEIYLKCSPEVLTRHREENTTFHQVSSVLKYLMPKKAPKAAMFGPGLESSTSAIVRQMLYENDSVFTRVAMFPGQFDGVGAGMTLQLLHSSQTFHLSVLYSASRRERENQPQQNRMSRNRMLNQQPQREGDISGPLSYELQPAIQQLCHTLNAFIFVVDATESRESVASSREELMTMVQERWAAPHVPVLVLSCVPTANTPRLPAMDLVHILQLSAFHRPWMVMDCVVDTLQNVDKGVLWMIEMCQRK